MANYVWGLEHRDGSAASRAVTEAGSRLVAGPFADKWMSGGVDCPSRALDGRWARYSG